MSTPELKKLKDRIRELTERVTTAEPGDIERLTKELQNALHQHSEEARRTMLSQSRSITERSSEGD